MGCGFPAALVSPSNPQECATGTHGILAILSRFPRRPRRRIDPENHPPPYIQTVRSSSTFTRGRSTRFSRSIVQVHHDSPCLYTLVVLSADSYRDLRTIPRREGHLSRYLSPRHVYCAFNSKRFCAEMAIQCSVKNINLHKLYPSQNEDCTVV